MYHLASKKYDNAVLHHQMRVLVFLSNSFKIPGLNKCQNTIKKTFQAWMFSYQHYSYLKYPFLFSIILPRGRWQNGKVVHTFSITFCNLYRHPPSFYLNWIQRHIMGLDSRHCQLRPSPQGKRFWSVYDITRIVSYLKYYVSLWSWNLGIHKFLGIPRIGIGGTKIRGIHLSRKRRG